jgi:hypothetical protein
MDMKISYSLRKGGGLMSRKSLLAASFLALLLPVPSMARVEHGASVRSVLPVSASYSSFASTTEVAAPRELARGYGWKRARKKPTIETQDKKAAMQVPVSEGALTQADNAQFARGYSWKRARKKMLA